MAKFVNSKTIVDYAKELHDTQQAIAKLAARMAELQETEKQLTQYLLKANRGSGFEFNNGAYLMQFKVTHHNRMILDQDRVREILKSKTPYKPSSWTTTKVDFVYEK